MTDLRLELVPPEGNNNLDIFATLSGRRIPLWLTLDGAPREVLVTRVTGDGGDPQRITIDAHCAPDLDDLPGVAEATFLGWRVESLTER